MAYEINKIYSVIFNSLSIFRIINFLFHIRQEIFSAKNAPVSGRDHIPCISYIFYLITTLSFGGPTLDIL